MSDFQKIPKKLLDFSAVLYLTITLVVDAELARESETVDFTE